MSGSVIAVSISEKKGTKKRNVEEITLLQGQGIIGDAHSGPGERQISLLSIDSIDRMRELGLDLSPGDFAENITVKGFDLPSLQMGTVLRLGDSVLLKITQIGKDCHERCAIYHSAGDCVMPREGIFAEVINGGLIRPGDRVIIE